MKRLMVFIGALALATAAFAIPDELFFGLEGATSPGTPKVRIIDEGAGDIAIVFIADKTDFDPWAKTLLQAFPARPRVVAIVLNGGVEAAGGQAVLTSLVGNMLENKGIGSACIVTCGNCAPAAASIAQSIDATSGLVLVGPMPMPEISMQKPVFIASNFGSSLTVAVSRILDLPDSRIMKPMIE